MATIARDGHLTAIRMQRGAVLLDERRERIVEVHEDGAVALDLVLFDQGARLPETDAEAQRIRVALRALRRELFDDSPGRGADIELANGEAYLRRYPEPTSWRRPTLVRPHANDAAHVTFGIVRGATGALALIGARSVVTSVTSAFGSEGTPPEDVVVAGAETIFIRTPMGEELRPIEIWGVDLGEREGLTLTRLAPARALVKLLCASRARPSDEVLSVLALCAERVPHFGVSVPRKPDSLARVVTEYLRAALR